MSQPAAGMFEEISTPSESDDYMVMSIKKNAAKLKIPSARVQVEMPGKKMLLCVDSGFPFTIFSMTDLKAALGKTNLHLQPIRELFPD